MTFFQRPYRWIFLLFVLTIRLWIASDAAANNFSDLNILIGDRDAVLLTDPQGQVLFARNVDLQLVPASTLKIFTALVALHYLGSDYRFTTEFYLDPNSNLTVKGYGDPMLISETLQNIATSLALHFGPSSKTVHDLILDDSYFDNPVLIPGVASSFEPYDAPNGALCVNFNTVFFKRDASGTYTSAEPQTPLIEFITPKVVASRMDHGRIALSCAQNEHTLYAGHMLRYFLAQEGIRVEGKIRIGKVKTTDDTLIYRYVSDFSLAQIISKLMQHSNNFVANQLLVAAGAHAYGPPGTLFRGIRAASAFAENKLRISDFNISEGSGISRENLISASSMDKILQAFGPYHPLMVSEENVYYKTGTLCDVNNRAGYIKNNAGELYRFVILVNTPGKSADQIMDKLLSNFVENTEQ